MDTILVHQNTGALCYILLKFDRFMYQGRQHNAGIRRISCTRTYLCVSIVQGGSNMTGTDCGLFTHKSVPVIREPSSIWKINYNN